MSPRIAAVYSMFFHWAKIIFSAYPKTKHIFPQAVTKKCWSY